MSDYIVPEGSIPEYESVDYEWGNGTRRYRTFTRSAGVTADARSYTSIENGTIRLGYYTINTSTGQISRTPMATISFFPLVSSQKTTILDGGLEINTSRIKFFQNRDRDDAKIHTRMYINNIYMGGFLKTFYCHTTSGFLTVVTQVTKSQSNGFAWTIEEIPFINGICVAQR